MLTGDRCLVPPIRGRPRYRGPFRLQLVAGVGDGAQAHLDAGQGRCTGRGYVRKTVACEHPLTLSAGYKEYKTDRTYMARMGDWRNDKDMEIPLDGIGGVNILVKADVHRSGTCQLRAANDTCPATDSVVQVSTSHATPSRTKPRPKVSPRWRGARATASSAFQTTLSGTSIQRRSPAMRRRGCMHAPERSFARVDVG